MNCGVCWNVDWIMNECAQLNDQNAMREMALQLKREWLWLGMFEMECDLFFGFVKKWMRRMTE